MSVAAIAPHEGEPRTASAFGASSALLPLLAATGAGLWLLGFTRSLWLDETLTAWVVAEDFSTMLRRAVTYQFSWLGFVPPWLSSRALGHTEAALRLPSILAMLVAAWGVARLGRELWGRDAGWLAAAAFVTAPMVITHAPNARPYALFVALVVLSMWRWLVWLRGGRVLHAAQAAFLAGLAAHAQPVAAGVVLLAPAIFVLAAAVRHPRLRRGAAAAAAVGAVLLVALWPVWRGLLRAGGSLSYAPPATPGAAFEIAAPPLVVCSALLALLTARVAWREPVRAPAWPASTLVFLLGWLLLPCLAVLAVSRFTAWNIMVPQYLMGITPALPLLAGGLLSAMTPPRARAAAAAVIVLAAAATHRAELRPQEDWRGAAAAVRAAAGPSTPVLVVAGLVEGADVRWLRDPQRSAYLLAPFQHYAVPGRVVPFPSRADASTMPYLDEIVAGLQREPRFVLVARADGSDIARFLTQKLAGRTLAVQTAPAKNVYVALFQDPAATASPPP